MPDPPDVPPGSPHRRVRRRSRPGRWIRTILAAGFLLLLLDGGAMTGLLAPSSGTLDASGCPTGVSISGAGASFLLPLVAEWTVAFEAGTGNPVDYNGNGAGAGITELRRSTVDFAATDEPPSPPDASLVTLPIAGGALAIIYDLPGLAAPLHLSGPLLAGIYEGSIRSWNDPRIAALNPGETLANAQIVTVHRSDAAGTTYVLTDLLSRDSPTWAAGPGRGISIGWPSAPTQEAIPKNAGLAEFVARTPYAVGYADLTDVLGTPGLAVAALENPSGAFVLPTLASAGSAISDLVAQTSFPAATGDWSNVSMVNAPGPGDYPLATLAYFLVPAELDRGFAPSSGRALALVEWIAWTIENGARYATMLDYVGLPSSLTALDVAALASITFGGAAVRVC
ncbi:MAG TPA: phosphate ABC transporter substrate-binding protein PstS, partial [Thermoplasmata archaeon]|nr:phosphate ABC transporter substrate-binding protein PstS [Thermoplasmata archaeon]